MSASSSASLLRVFGELLAFQRNLVFVHLAL